MSPSSCSRMWASSSGKQWRGWGAERGVSLIVVLIMTVVIGLTAAASMRASLSGERVVNNLRMEALAQQYAEAALSYCEAEISKASASRIAGLQDNQITTTNVVSATNVYTLTWQSTATWVDPAVNGRVDLPMGKLQTTDSSFTPTQAPQCFVEIVMFGSGDSYWSIVARGFSPGYAWDATTGRTTKGSVVWLQSMRPRIT
jgi:type IV pilus assembly protein PilX